MPWLKIFLWVAATPFILLALFIAAVLIELEVLYPIQHARLQKEAQAWNDENWETGFALQVSVQVTSNAALGSETDSATITCYQRNVASPGGLKGAPTLGTRTISDGAETLRVAFGPEATHSTPLRDVCSDAFRESQDWTLPKVTESHHYWSYIEANDQAFRCFLANDPRTTRGEVSRPTFVAVRKVPLRDLISKASYREAPPQSLKSDVRPPPTVYWWTDEVQTKCWRETVDTACRAQAEVLCGTPFD